MKTHSISCFISGSSSAESTSCLRIVACQQCQSTNRSLTLHEETDQGNDRSTSSRCLASTGSHAVHPSRYFGCSASVSHPSDWFEPDQYDIYPFDISSSLANADDETLLECRNDSEYLFIDSDVTSVRHQWQWLGRITSGSMFSNRSGDLPLFTQSINSPSDASRAMDSTERDRCIIQLLQTLASVCLDAAASHSIQRRA